MSITKERYRLNPNDFCIGGWWKGRKRKPFTQEHKDKLTEIRSHFIMPSGKNHCRWKGGISKDRKQYFRNYYKTKGKFFIQMRNNKRRLLTSDLSLETIQRVYENNIKKYGTLTCYLCIKPILFGKDHLEHKIPLSRGGDNSYKNLGIACAKCNLKKNNKTITEYKEEVQFANSTE